MDEIKPMTLERWRNVINATEESFRVDEEVALALEQRERLEQVLEETVLPGRAVYLYTGKYRISFGYHSWQAWRYNADVGTESTIGIEALHIGDVITAVDKLEAEQKQEKEKQSE